MAARVRRRQWIALILSGVFPGLGQFYIRAWGKGVAFLLAGLAATWALGRIVAVEDLLAGRLSQPRGTLLAALALLGLYVWNFIDAWRSAAEPGA